MPNINLLKLNKRFLKTYFIFLLIFSYLPLIFFWPNNYKIYNNLFFTFKYNFKKKNIDQYGNYSASYITGINNKIFAQQTNNNMLQIFMVDHKNSMLKIINDNNSNGIIYKYNSYGALKNDSSLNLRIKKNSFFYNGERYDLHTNLQYLRARFYLANLKRFIQADSFTFILNKFNYANANPTNSSDASGHIAVEDIINCDTVGNFAGFICMFIDTISNVVGDSPTLRILGCTLDCIQTSLVNTVNKKHVDFKNLSIDLGLAIGGGIIAGTISYLFTKKFINNEKYDRLLINLREDAEKVNKNIKNVVIEDGATVRSDKLISTESITLKLKAHQTEKQYAITKAALFESMRFMLTESIRYPLYQISHSLIKDGKINWNFVANDFVLNILTGAAIGLITGATTYACNIFAIKHFMRANKVLKTYLEMPAWYLAVPNLAIAAFGQFGLPYGEYFLENYAGVNLNFL